MGPASYEAPSEVCRRTGFQHCHACEDADCGDNENPSIVKIRQALKDVEKIIDTIPPEGQTKMEAMLRAQNNQLSAAVKREQKNNERLEKQLGELADDFRKQADRLAALEDTVIDALVSFGKGRKRIPLKEMVESVKTAKTLGGGDE